MQQNHNLWQKLVLLTLPCHFSTFSKLQNSKKEKLTVPKTKEKIHVNINSANRETESIEEALLLAIITTIEKSEIFPNIAEEFNKRKNQDNAHFNCLLMLKLAKQYLWKQKYNSPQSIENAFDMHNTSVKLEFFLK